MYFSIEDAALINLCWLCNCVWSGHIMIAHDTTQSTHVLTEYTTITIQIIFYPAYNIQGQDYHFAQELLNGAHNLVSNHHRLKLRKYGTICLCHGVTLLQVAPYQLKYQIAIINLFTVAYNKRSSDCL